MVLDFSEHIFRERICIITLKIAVKVVSRELYYWSGQKWRPPEEGMWRLEIRGLRSSYPKNGKNISGRSISTCRTLKVEAYSMSSIKWDKALLKYGKWGETLQVDDESRGQVMHLWPKGLAKEFGLHSRFGEITLEFLWRMSGRQAMLFFLKVYFCFRVEG